ncbi:MAG TPA: hypothetical protein VIH55_04400 [Acidimicrobiia bacterium]
MSEAIESTAASVFMDDRGLLHIVSNGTPSTKTTVRETFGAARTLTEHPVPTLFDARRWPVGGSDFWVAFIDVLPSVVSAGAILIEPDEVAGLGGFPRAVNRLMVPFEVFTEEDEAIAFLVPFIRSVDPEEE